MRCPCCLHKIHLSAEECPHCGLTISVLDSLYEGVDPRIKSPNDGAGVLSVYQRSKVAKAVSSIEQRFPQLCLRVVTCALGNGQSVQSFGFWLMNRGHFFDQQDSARADGIVLLVIDVQHKEVCLHFGHLLDALVDEEESFAVLLRAHPYLLESNYYEATMVMLSGARTYLKRLRKRAQRRTRKS